MRVLLVIFFLMLSHWLKAQPQTIEKIVAVVGDEVVLLSEIESSLAENAKGKAITQDMRCKALEGLLYQKLLLHHSKVDSVEVSDGDVNAQVQRRIDYFVQMFGSEEEFEKYYGKTIAVLKEEFFDAVKEQLLIEKEQQEVTKNTVTTPADVLKFFQNQPKDSIPLIPEQLSYSEVVFAPKIKEREVNKVIHFMDSIRNEIIIGRTSMTLQAAKWSEDPGSKYKGGCYPLQRRGTFVPEYEAAVYNTDEGKFTPVFKSDFGYHFVKVIQKRGDFYETCHILMTPKVSDTDLDKAHALADSVYSALNKKEISFHDATLRFSTDEETKNQDGQVMNPATGGVKHEIGSIDPEISLLLSRMKPGEISEPILSTTIDGVKRYVIYRLDDRINAHKANMDLDYEIFQNAATGNSKKTATDKWVQNKLKRTYIRIDDTYKNECAFEFKWIN
jgi:peptidyl-prolyl cis-trans isomerase SurA